MNALGAEALRIREIAALKLVRRKEVPGWKALAFVVAPSPELEAASP
jgi:hypothetical protein